MSDKFFIVYFHDGFQTICQARSAWNAIDVAKGFEEMNSRRTKRRPRTPVRASKMSDDPAIQKKQADRVSENNRALLKGTKQRTRSRKAPR
jgi:hypothetical protein